MNMFNPIVLILLSANTINAYTFSQTTGLILGLRPVNERRRFKVTPSLIGRCRFWLGTSKIYVLMRKVVLRFISGKLNGYLIRKICFIWQWLANQWFSWKLYMHAHITTKVPFPCGSLRLGECNNGLSPIPEQAITWISAHLSLSFILITLICKQSVVRGNFMWE